MKWFSGDCLHGDEKTWVFASDILMLKKMSFTCGPSYGCRFCDEYLFCFSDFFSIFREFSHCDKFTVARFGYSLRLSIPKLLGGLYPEVTQIEQLEFKHSVFSPGSPATLFAVCVFTPFGRSDVRVWVRSSQAPLRQTSFSHSFFFALEGAADSNQLAVVSEVPFQRGSAYSYAHSRP